MELSSVFCCGKGGRDCSVRVKCIFGDMVVFETERLVIRFLKEADRDYFTELLNAPEIREPVPQEPFSLDEVEERFNQNLEVTERIDPTRRYAWAVCPKGSDEVIGLCLFLINDEGDRELGYRFRKAYWGKGYGTESTRGMINYSFHVLGLDKVTADVTIGNIPSMKILEKFLHPVRDFYNPRDKCMDRRYELYKKDRENSIGH